MAKYDYVIVGCGLFGATFANQALKNDLKVLILDKRDHIAGNCYTSKVGLIDIHEYGPHIFHTSNEKIWNYVNTFTKFNNYVNRPKVRYKDQIYSFPINLFTLYQLWGVSTPAQAQQKLDAVKIKIDHPTNLEEWILSEVGEEIYNIFIRGYTKKQWNTDPKNLPTSIIRRLPIRLNYNDNYFNDTYQGIPVDGYTQMITNMLEGCDIRLSVNYFDDREQYDKLGKHIIYTGPIDRFFEYEHGHLDYRSLRFEQTILPIEDFQGNAIINYAEESVPYTRIIEHKHLNLVHQDNTVITKEFPQNYTPETEPFYPINNLVNNEIYDKYYAKTKIVKPKYFFGGRLAEYKYYDMHQVIASSLHLADQLL